jgi:hypothetical protein
VSHDQSTCRQTFLSACLAKLSSLVCWPSRLREKNGEPDIYSTMNRAELSTFTLAACDVITLSLAAQRSSHWSAAIALWTAHECNTSQHCLRSNTLRSRLVAALSSHQLLSSTIFTSPAAPDQTCCALLSSLLDVACNYCQPFVASSQFSQLCASQYPS